MKILAIADVESKYLWDFYQPGMLDDIDLILSAGDLDSNYLSFLVTMAHCPLLYVPGNHDTGYDRKPPEGCINIDGKIFLFNGIRILGLGGSMNYNFGQNQYTEFEMKRKVLNLAFPLLLHKGFDILLTHAPTKDFHDGKDLPHQGFQIFHTLIDRFHPKYHIHGHVHKEYSHDFSQFSTFNQTTVINAYERYIFEYE